jgi:hypothetical protein
MIFALRAVRYHFPFMRESKKLDKPMPLIETFRLNISLNSMYFILVHQFCKPLFVKYRSTPFALVWHSA